MDVKPKTKSKCINKACRPSIYDDELADLICERVATNSIGLAKLCAKYDDMPSEVTIYQWRYKYPEFAEKFRQAKMFQAEVLAESINELCDIESYMDEYGVERVDSGIVARQRLKIDSIKWQASKLAPKLYGLQTKEEKSADTSVLEKLITGEIVLKSH
jgi:hypothetical protein